MTGLVQPIFVVGCPRSGTTLIQCILSASSRAFSLPETHFFSGVLPAVGANVSTLLGPERVAAVRRAMDAEAELVLPDAFWADLRRRLPLTAGELFVEVVEYFRPLPEVRAIEKTPRHVLALESIAAAFPDAVFVNVVRDPIDVASSLLGVPFESSRSVLSYAQRWTESIQAARAFSRVAPARIKTVLYEQLVHAAELHVRELSAFVDLPYEAAMLEEFGREAARNVGRGEAWKRDVSKGVIVDRQGVWRTRMTPGQAWLVAQATRTLRREYGYRDRPGASVASITAALAREAQVRFREARASTGVVGAARHAGSVLKTLSTA
ncbi:MAG TPA: sulfotransferase [Chloroflexota bacterium]|jgi:hypothetical protein|nr:sulfotransferase [Chloroflexota bacterium]